MSSVWISRAAGFTARIARIASAVPRHWLNSARRQVASSRPCGYQCP